MHFSIAPKDLDVAHFLGRPASDTESGPSASSASSSVRSGVALRYEVSDVYYAEVCVLNHVCRNRRKLFSLKVGALFECQLDEAAFEELQTILA